MPRTRSRNFSVAIARHTAGISSVTSKLRGRENLLRWRNCDFHCGWKSVPAPKDTALVNTEAPARQRWFLLSHFSPLFLSPALTPKEPKRPKNIARARQPRLSGLIRLSLFSLFSSGMIVASTAQLRPTPPLFGGCRLRWALCAQYDAAALSSAGLKFAVIPARFRRGLDIDGKPVCGECSSAITCTW